MSSNSGVLWIVATPLGNPGDLSPRAREILASVGGILAEDTRRSGRLLAEVGIAAPPFTSFHDHNEEARLPRVLAWLEEGKHLALVSDAGTPLLSDPGYRLVRACRERGIRVSPLPGPFAPAAALSAAGLPPYPFVFLGFLPRKDADRRSLLARFAFLDATLVFFERKDRLASTLEAACRELGQREVCIARELTKTHEEFLRFPLSDYATALPGELLGEITVLIGPPEQGARSPVEDVDQALAEEAAAGGKARDVAARARQRLRGWSGKELYDRLRAGAASGEEA